MRLSGQALSTTTSCTPALQSSRLKTLPRCSLPNVASRRSIVECQWRSRISKGEGKKARIAASAPNSAPGGASSTTQPDQQALERTQARLDAFLAEVRRTTIVVLPPPPPLNIAEPFVKKESTSQPTALPSKENECMVMIFPGAALAPTNYKALATATSQAAAAKYGAAGLRCWVTIAGVDLLQLLPLLGELEAMEQPNAPPGTAPLPSAEMLAPKVFKEVVELASEQGFSNKSSRSGRLTNVLVAPHSAAGLYFGDAAVKHAGGLAMLGSTWSSDVLGKLAIAGGWLAGSRPMMMLTGELDGQMGWPHIMPYAAQVAWNGLRQGATYAIINKPLILLPGVNHGQLCGSPPNFARGDCVPDNSEAQALDTAADCLTAFLVLHFLPQPSQNSAATNQQQHGKQPSGPHSNWPRTPSVAAASAALGVLQRGVHWTVNALTPYAAATGLGDLRGAWIRAVAIDQDASKWDDVWTGPQLPPDPSNPASIFALDFMVPPPFGMAPNVGVPSSAAGGVWGAPPPPPPSPMGPMAARTYALGPLSACTPGLSPGIVMAAERSAAEAQMCIAGGAVTSGLLPPAALGRVRVVASVHPTLNSFLYSQPTVRPLPGGRAEVHVQCFQHFPALDRAQFMPSGLYPASPDLWLKLKSGAGLATELRHELGLPRLEVEEDGAQEGSKLGKPVSMPAGSPAAVAFAGMKGVTKMGIAGTEEGAVSAADVNRAAMEWALKAAPEEMRKRYLARGVPLEFGKDMVEEAAPKWVKFGRIRFEVLTEADGDGGQARQQGSPAPQGTGGVAAGDAGDVPGSSNGSSAAEPGEPRPRAVLVRSPVLRGVAVDNVGNLGAEDRRFIGSLYIKVISRAMALEWVSIGGVRQATQGTKCLWGGH